MSAFDWWFVGGCLYLSLLIACWDEVLEILGNVWRTVSAVGRWVLR